ncbi:L-proline glycine betaine ABC transport system permease protein ProV [Caenispirillum salinarum AK4]|uniref:Trimethylamine N-oxide transport system ATP-binding protein TmoW n=1 Tax=Caenispirillum salinarum AK4 TaxID=1238182 RepID=K9GVW0_9PROT|nr:choline ABC transporter ATP-binding protein [Caenispirillum salinarum]EKV30085.1 L-proline glycine betaine ABC transport system permease protein ProV [Caenispirillum salinarum AK4]
MTDTAVSFRHIDVVFGKKPAPAIKLMDEGRSRAEIQEKTGHVVGVSDATLDVRQGEICVLMGLSGSGKSTLLRCVNGLNRPTRGELIVNVNGESVDVASCDVKTLRRLRTKGIAMVFQQFALLPWRTVAENVGFGLEVQGISKKERDRIVDERLAMVGLSEWRDAFAHELSGGMQQRVGLARAFAQDAPILLMDEPFSALDPLIRNKLQDELLVLQKELQKTIIFVSHDLDEAMKLGSRIAIMESGKVVQYGTPEDIALHPADAYVADFVAHMNPVNVLKASSVMTPLADAPRAEGGAVVAEPETDTRVTMDAAGHAVSAESAAHEASPVVPYEQAAADPQALAEGTVVTAPADITLREAMEIRRATAAPLVVEEDGRAVGVLGNKELYAAVLGEPAAGSQPEAAPAPRDSSAA